MSRDQYHSTGGSKKKQQDKQKGTSKPVGTTAQVSCEPWSMGSSTIKLWWALLLRVYQFSLSLFMLQAFERFADLMSAIKTPLFFYCLLGIFHHSIIISHHHTSIIHHQRGLKKKEAKIKQCSLALSRQIKDRHL